MEVKILGGGQEVGRSAVYLKHGDKGILLDYGISFDEEDKPKLPLHVRPIDVSFIGITHAHLDHVGAAPYLFIGENPRVFATRPTMDIARLLILDFLKLNSYYVEYEIREFDRMYRSTVFLDYGERVDLDEFTVQLFDAGHILGSSMVYIEAPNGEKILYTGDFNTLQTWTLRSAERPLQGVTTLIVESTYGGRNHPERHHAEKRLVEVVEETIDRGGTVLIPAFSVGRTQEVITVLHVQAPYLDIYVDGMSRDITEIYLKHKKFLRDPALFQRVVENVNFVTDSSMRRKLVKKPTPCVIVASAGMLKGGPSLYYLKHLAQDGRNSIVLVSYQAVNSNGHKLLETGVLKEQGIDYPVKARVEWIDLSSHAGRDDIVKYIDGFRSTLKDVIIVHGSPQDAKELAARIREVLGNDVRVHVPANGETVNTYL
ncbi:MAG: MBL fold metallo-hydrolase [Desulfurococcaceae archaeon]